MAPRNPVRPDPMCPPRFVRDIQTGRTYPWSPLFKKKLGQLEVYYRPKTDDKAWHIAKKTQQQKQGGGVYPQLIIHDEGDTLDEPDGS